MEGLDDDDRLWFPSWDYVEMRRGNVMAPRLCFTGCDPDCPCPTGRRWETPDESFGKGREPAQQAPAHIRGKRTNCSDMTAEEYRAIMYRLGYNQTTLARKLSVSRMTSFKYANGKSGIPKLIKQKMLQALDARLASDDE